MIRPTIDWERFHAAMSPMPARTGRCLDPRDLAGAATGPIARATTSHIRTNHGRALTIHSGWSCVHRRQICALQIAETRAKQGLGVTHRRETATVEACIFFTATRFTDGFGARACRAPVGF